jgi:hypothetical protein
VETDAPPAHGAEPALGPDTVTLTVRARSTEVDTAAWPYGPRPLAPGDGAEVPVRMIPFDLRANRGPTAMRVWLPARPPRKGSP